MVWMVLIFMSVVVFAWTSHQLMRSIATPKIRRRTAEYSVLALRVERAYRIFAWGAASLVVFAWLILSLIESAARML